MIQNILLLGLAGFVLADPTISTSHVTMTTTSIVRATTATVTATKSSSHWVEDTSMYTDLPTLPADASAYLVSLYSEYSSEYNFLQTACSLPSSIPDPLSTAPAKILSEISVYQSQFESFIEAHTEFLGSGYDSSYGIPTMDCGFSGPDTSKPASTITSTTTTRVGSTSSSETSSAAKQSNSSSSPSPTKTGSAVANTSSSASGTGTGTAAPAKTTNSSAASSTKGGYVMSFAGVFGVLGFMATL